MGLVKTIYQSPCRMPSQPHLLLVMLLQKPYSPPCNDLLGDQVVIGLTVVFCVINQY
jgi:hypothetical protein